MKTAAVSPVVGCVADRAVDDGDAVAYADLVCSVESMKTMFPVYAPAAGVVEYAVELGEVIGQEDTVFWVVTED